MAPENTFAAFRRALADGAEGVECDVRLAKDGVPVVFHDTTLKRTALLDARVCDLTARELSKIDVGSWFNFKRERYANKKYSKETVPTLAQFFELMRGASDKAIYVELKCEDNNHYRFARAVVEILQSSDLLNRAIVKSFEHECLFEIKKLLPKARVAALFRPNPARILRPGRKLVKPALRLNAEELSLHYTLATAMALRKAHNANLRTVIWTADHPAWVKRAFKLGIHGIITNNPARLLARREQLLAKENF